MPWRKGVIMRGFSTLGINLFDSFDHFTGNIKKITTYKQRVGGSTPSTPTLIKKGLGR
jgi:hypothetical protein